ncbi:MAG: V-type ATP synthase subunit E family protein [Spirochaetia bacterium]
MDILKTSDALESQILEEARTKARRIRKAADKECEVIRTEAERRSREEVRRLEAGSEQEIAAIRQELTAALPLDFMRTRLAFIQGAVDRAMSEFFDTLPAAELDRLIGKMLARAAYAFKGAHVVVSCAGMSAEQAKRVVAGNVPDAVVDEVRQLPTEEAAAAGKGIVLQTSDASRRYRGTLNEMKSVLLEEYREELVAALLGKDVSL